MVDARMRFERWIARLIRNVRRGRLTARADSALFVIAHHRELDGTLLPSRTAAVELLNILRPTVPVAWHVAFAALALHEYPHTREAIAREPVEDTTSLDPFMQELRRLPVHAVSRREGTERIRLARPSLEPGMLVLLDV